jgi:hypothetical protein
MMTELLGKGETKVVFEVVLHPASIIKPKIIHHMRLMDEKHIAHPLMMTAAQRLAHHPTGFASLRSARLRVMRVLAAVHFSQFT